VAHPPAAYSVSSLPDGVRSISFEEAAKAIRTDGADPRAEYRAAFLEQAAKGKIIALGDYDPFRAQWWNAVDAMIRREFGGFFVNDRTAFPKTTYVNPKCADMAGYLRVDLKGHLGEVDLAFKNVPMDILSPLLDSIKPANTKLVQNGKSVALRINKLEPFLVSDGLDVIESRVLPAYSAAHELLRFWKENRQTFDQVVSSAYA